MRNRIGQAIFIENVEEMCFFIAHVCFFSHLAFGIRNGDKDLLGGKGEGRYIFGVVSAA